MLSDDTIRLHLNEYALFKKLKPEGGGSSEKLNKNQSQKLEEHLNKHTYRM
jgi:hypothetical protein